MELWVQQTRNQKGVKERAVYSQPPLMDRHNRGDLREGGEKTEESKECERERDPAGIRRRRGRADQRACTHAFSCGDVNGAGDVGQALVHAHLQVDHPANQQNVTRTSHHIARLHSCTARALACSAATHSSIHMGHSCVITAQTC